VLQTFNWEITHNLYSIHLKPARISLFSHSIVKLSQDNDLFTSAHLVDNTYDSLQLTDANAFPLKIRQWRICCVSTIKRRVTTHLSQCKWATELKNNLFPICY